VDVHARNSTSVKQRQRCNSCTRIIAAIGSTPPPSPSAAALAQPTSTHLVSVHNYHVAIIAATFNLSNMHDSDEEAAALQPHPPELGRPAFVRHAAGGGGGMQRLPLL
jgi:hypothetical protein